MESTILSREDISFLLYAWLKVEELIHRPAFEDHSRETFDAYLELSERVATEKFANHNQSGDVHEATMVDGKVRLAPGIAEALHAFANAGLTAAGQDYSFGGMRLPMVVEKAGFAWFLAANMATSSIPFLTIGNANLLLKYGAPKLVEQYAKPMLEGRYFGTMCLSEPHAGSSLADIRTQAVPQEDGTYRLFGNKMWISAGDHELGANIVHLVLARIEGAPAGVKGISLFLVPRHLLDEHDTPGERNDIALAGLNHKMGTRGVPNCLLNFGEGAYRPGGKSGAIGWLVAQPNAGLAAMFHMMNEARIGVGLMASALGYTAYLHALKYAKQRPQGYSRKGRARAGSQIPIIQHADVRRMLLAQKCYAEGGLALNLYCAKLVDQELTSDESTIRHESHLLLDLLTPVAKSWSAQWCTEGCSLAIQVHGGYGYTRDFPIEQFYRDNRLNAIHEGTHGIHALDLLGRKIELEGGAAFAAYCRVLEASIKKCDPHSELMSFASTLAKKLCRLREVTDALSHQPDAESKLANATAYLEAFGHITIAWIWLELMMAAANDTAFERGKRHAGKYFYRWELPKVDNWLDRLAAFDDTSVIMQEDWF